MAHSKIQVFRSDRPQPLMALFFTSDGRLQHRSIGVLGIGVLGALDFAHGHANRQATDTRKSCNRKRARYFR